MADENTLLICLSPRAQGTSAMLLRRLQARAGGQLHHLKPGDDPAPLLQLMMRARRIVFSGPCYINSYPAIFSALMALAQGHQFSGQQLYGIINGGMPYIHTHQSALHQLALFAQQCNLNWMGGFVLGGGAMLDGKPLEKHMSARKVVPAYHAFCRQVVLGEPAPDSLYLDAQPPPGPLFSRFFARMLSHTVRRRLKRLGQDARSPSPYIE